MIALLAFYLFATVMIASAVCVIFARNPVHSVLFLILAFVIFLIVRYANRMNRKAENAPAGPSEIELLTEIRDELKRRP